jgi:hypothetical protein
MCFVWIWEQTAIYVKLFYFEVKWSEVSYGEITGDKIAVYIGVTLYWGHLIVLCLFHLVCILYCDCCNLFCNEWVCVCGGVLTIVWVFCWYVCLYLLCFCIFLIIYIYSYFFCLYYGHRVTTQLQLVTTTTTTTIIEADGCDITAFYPYPQS